MTPKKAVLCNKSQFTILICSLLINFVIIINELMMSLCHSKTDAIKLEFHNLMLMNGVYIFVTIFISFNNTVQIYENTILTFRQDYQNVPHGLNI